MNKIKKPTTVVLTVVWLVIFLSSIALAKEEQKSDTSGVYGSNTYERLYPGDQRPAENYQFGEGADIKTLKKLESEHYPLMFLLLAGTGVSLGVSAGAGVSAGYTSESLIIAIIQSYKSYISEDAEGRNSLLWINYPPSSFSFDSAERESLHIIRDTFTNISTEFLNIIANMLFYIGKAATIIGNNLLILCFDSNWAKESANWIGEVVKSMTLGSDNGSFLSSSLYIFFILAIAALSYTVFSKILRSNLTSAFSTTLLSVLCVVGLIFYVANTPAIISGICSFTDGLAGAGMSLASVLAEERIESNDASSLRKGIIAVTNAAWNAHVAYPWCLGQFGTTDVDNLKMTKSEWSEGNNSLKSAIENDKNEEIIDEETNTKTGIRLGKDTMDKMVNNGTLYIDTVFLGSDDEVRQQLLTALGDPENKHGKHRTTIFTCSAGVGSGWKHLISSLFGSAVSVTYLFLVIILGVPIIIAQLMLILLFIFLPFALIIGVGGEKGHNFFKVYAGLVIKSLAVKVFNGFYLGATMFFAFTVVKALL